MAAAAPKKGTRPEGERTVPATGTARTKRVGDARLRPTLRQPASALGSRATHTIGKILVATKDVFLTSGYAGTSVDEITQKAGVSRASFYTYFPTKRDALLTLGAHASNAAEAATDRLASFGPEFTFDQLHAWVVDYFELLHDHGAFSLAWTQAAGEEIALRKAGMKRHLAICARLGAALGSLRGQPFARATDMGLLVFSMLDRSWSFGSLYRTDVDLGALQRQAASVIAAIVRGVHE